jgi:hypothetical protein
MYIYEDCKNLSTKHVFDKRVTKYEQNYNIGVGYAGTGDVFLKLAISMNDFFIQFEYRHDETHEWISYSTPFIKTEQPLGGYRYWFICPVTNNPASKLYLTPYDERFVSCKAYPLRYKAQVLSKHKRRLLRIGKAQEKLDAALEENRSAKTIEALKQKLEAIHLQCVDETTKDINKLVQRINKKRQ